MQSLTPYFMRFAGIEIPPGNANASDQARNEQAGDKNSDKLTLEKKHDPVLAAKEKVNDLLIRNDFKGAFDLLREMRDYRTIDGGKLNLSQKHMEGIEDQMRDLVINKLCPDDPLLQKNMFSTLNLAPAPVSAPVLAPAPAPRPAMTFSAAPAPSVIAA